MVLEMKRALEELKSGNTQGYRRLYDATYEEVYTRSLLIIQNEDQALEYIKDFYKDVFGALEEAEEAQDTERWFLRRYYQKLRKHYHRLLGKQEKTEPGSGVKTLAEIPAAFPLLHRIMLVMSFKDDFPASEISAIYGLAEDKIQSELEKLEKAGATFPNKQQQDVRIRYVAPIVIAAGMVATLATLIGLFLWAYNEDPSAAPPMVLIVALVAISALLICGVLFALFQRIREIGKGEIDDAKKY